MPKTISQLPAATVISGSAVVAADNAAGTLTERVTLAAIAGLASSGNQVVSSGAISNLTTNQQSSVKEGTVVTTTDGKRWVYTGAGSKTSEASYIELADITPAWSSIADKPSTFTPSSHAHPISDVTNLQTSLDAKVSSITTGITGADQITNMVSLTQAEYDAIATKSATTFYVITD